MSGAAVRLVNVSKRFRLGENHESVRDLIAAGVGRLLRRRADRPDRCESTFWAVRDVDLEVSRGEAVGIIGPNGAGKSTILRLLAGILRADSGEVLVDGRLAALIEVGAGFHGDLTGRENVFLNGAILGMNRAEIRRKLDSIVSFAGIERFLDMPVKRYSSGMYARLGFSIAAHVDPDVLLVDEVLSVGDAVFRLRCLERMGELVRGGTTLVFVTHDLDQMQSACPRAVVLDHGGVTFNGPSREAVGHYLKAMSLAYAHRSADLVSDEDRGSHLAEVTGLRFLDADGEEVVWVRPHEPVRVELRFRLQQAISRVVVELNMRASLAESLLSVNSGRDGITCPGTVGEHTVTLTLPHVPLAGGQYFWNVRIWDVDRGVAVVDTPFRYPMAIDDQGCKTGKICLEHEWSFPKSSCQPAVDSSPQVEHALVDAGDRSEDLPVR